jgi:hypothetical protein
MYGNPAGLGSGAADFGTGPGGLSTAGDIGLSYGSDSPDRQAFNDLQAMRHVERERSKSFVERALDAIEDFVSELFSTKPEYADLSGFHTDINPEMGGSILREVERIRAEEQAGKIRRAREAREREGGWLENLPSMRALPDIDPNMPNPAEKVPQVPIPSFDLPGNPPRERGASLEGAKIKPASYTNTPAGLTFSTDSGERYIVSPTGRAQPLARVLQNLAHKVRSGGTPGATQRAIIDAMTPAQQRAAGIFLAPDGAVRPFGEVLTAAVVSAANGRPLTSNQQAALGLAFRSMPSSGAQRDAINALAGSAKGEVRDNISAAVQQSLRAAADIERRARTQALAPALGAAGVRRPLRAVARLAAAGVKGDAAGKLLALKAAGISRPVSQVERLAAQGVHNPVRRLLAQVARLDRTLATAAGTSVNQLRTLRAAGIQRPAQKVAQRAVNRARAGIKLTQAQREQLDRLSKTQQLSLGIFRSKGGGVVDPRKVAANAARNLAAGKPLNVRQNILLGQTLRSMDRNQQRALSTSIARARGHQNLGQGRKRVLPTVGAALRTAVAVNKTARAQAARAEAKSTGTAAALRAAAQATAKAVAARRQAAAARRARSGSAGPAAGTRPLPRCEPPADVRGRRPRRTRSAAQVAANAARNLKASRPLTPNQKRLLASRR